MSLSARNKTSVAILVVASLVALLLVLQQTVGPAGVSRLVYGDCQVLAGNQICPSKSYYLLANIDSSGRLHYFGLWPGRSIDNWKDKSGLFYVRKDFMNEYVMVVSMSDESPYMGKCGVLALDGLLVNYFGAIKMIAPNKDSLLALEVKNSPCARQ